MKKIIVCLILLIVSLPLVSCSPEDKTEKDEIVARINDCSLTLSEYQNQLNSILNLNEEYKLTREAREASLEELIRKELLIQEAKRLELDRTDKFIRTIERYWESTLIRNLMEIKGEEFTKRTLVSEEEIEATYNDMKKRGEELPLENMQEEITERIREAKKTQMLEQWIEGLRKAAKIETNQELIYRE